MYSYKSEPMYFAGNNNTDGDADLIYLNLDIINNNRNDGSSIDPVLRFNESRDAAILKDASKYQFSIVRFVMSGPNLDLPLFIPVIKTDQPDVNVTEYELAITYSQVWVTSENPAGILIQVTPAVNSVVYQTETQNPSFAPTPLAPNTGNGQDLSSRYYWVYTYQHWVDLVNQSLLVAHQNTFAEFQHQWTLVTADPFPYIDYAAWTLDVGQAPQMTYSVSTGLFSITANALSFGARLTPFVPTAVQLTAPECKLFFDTNMFALFANFPNTFYGGSSAGTLSPFYPTPLPTGYVNEILFPNKEYKNIVDYQTAPPAYIPAAQQGLFWVTEQELISTSSLWSPVSGIVFTTTLLPVRNESTGTPIVLGQNNLGYSSASIQNAFQPIITDIALDLSQLGSKEYRTSIYYSPQAEYRFASLTPSKQPIQNIDICVFWKNRLTGQLQPISIPNLGSVSMKCLFRRIRD